MHATQKKPKPIDPDKLLLSRYEAAHIMGFSDRFVDQLIADGTIKAKKYGRRVMVPRTECERLSSVEAA